MKSKELKVKITGFPFVSHVDQSKRPELEIDINLLYNGFQSDPLNNGHYKRMGYMYNLRPFLKNYILKQYGRWSEYYAPNKTILRRVIGGRIDKIIEIN